MLPRIISAACRASRLPRQGTRRFLSGKPAHPYTVPIVYEGSIFGVLAGERDKANMQALIATDGFDGNSVSCIIDRDSNVVISPTNLDFFFALDDLFVANKDPELASAVREMPGPICRQM